MAEWLLVRFAREPESDATWMVADDAGRMVIAPQSGAPTEAAGIAAGRHIALLVPGADVLVTEADVPVRSTGKLQQIVPYALEEQLAEDIDELHFAVGKRSESGRVPVVVVGRALLERWLATARAAGLVPEAVYADSQLLPANPGQAVALLEGDDAVLRTPGFTPVTLPAEALAESLDPGPSAPGDAPRGLVVYAAPGDWQRHAPMIEPLRERFDGIKVQLLANGPLALFAQQLPTAAPLNLLQGEYEPKTSFASRWRDWRVPATLAACLLGLHVVGKAVELGALQRAEREVDASIASAFRTAMPGEQSAVDARRRMEQRLASLGGDARSGGLLAMLGALAQARGSVPDASLQSLSYREGTLELRMRASSAESLDRLTQVLRSAGNLQADLTSGTASAQGYEGRLQLRAQSSP